VPSPKNGIELDWMGLENMVLGASTLHDCHNTGSSQVIKQKIMQLVYSRVISSTDAVPMTSADCKCDDLKFKAMKISLLKQENK
jgi:hypothetical protein